MKPLRWTLLLLVLLVTADLARANHNVDCTVSGGTNASNFECTLSQFNVEGGQVTPAQLSFDYNESLDCMAVNITPSDPWVSANPAAFVGTQTVVVTIDPSTLGSGVHETTLVLTPEVNCSGPRSLIVHVRVSVAGRGGCSGR